MKIRKKMLIILCAIMVIITSIIFIRHFVLRNEYYNISEDLESYVSKTSVMWIDRELEIQSQSELISEIKTFIKAGNSNKTIEKGVFYYRIIDISLFLTNEQVITYEIRLDDKLFDVFINIRYKGLLIDSITLENSEEYFNEINDFFF